MDRINRINRINRIRTHKTRNEMIKRPPTTPATTHSGHPARPLTRGEWRSAAEACAGMLLETPPHPQAGGVPVTGIWRLAAEGNRPS